jgi:hypothetical protein
MSDQRPPKRFQPRRSRVWLLAGLAVTAVLAGTAAAADLTGAKGSATPLRTGAGRIAHAGPSRATSDRADKRGPRGPRGRRGPRGPQGPQGEKGDKGDKGDPATKLWAVVTTDGTTATLVRGSGATGAEQSSPGFINVTFNQNVDACAYLVTTGRDDFSLPPRGGATADRDPGAPAKVYVQTFNLAGTATAMDFFLAVFC